MSQCPVCLELLWPEPVVQILEAHLLAHLELMQLSLTTDVSEHRLHYTEHADFRVLANQLRKLPLSIDLKQCLFQWKSTANLGYSTFEAECHHPLHYRCASALCTHEPPLNFIPLPRLVHWKSGSFTCPVCRGACQLTPPRNHYDVQRQDTHTLGPYRLHPGSWVWCYDELIQPGHHQAGSLGRLLGATSQQLHCLDVEVQGQVKSLPDRRVFDVTFFSTLGIPGRDQVGQLGHDLLEEHAGVLDVWAATESHPDQRWRFWLSERIQYCYALNVQRTELGHDFVDYLHTPHQWSILTQTSKRSPAADLWPQVHARLGLVSTTTLQPFPESPVSFRLLEKVSQSTRYPQLMCAIVLQYAQQGRLCNTGSAPQIVHLAHQITSDPRNTKLDLTLPLVPSSTPPVWFQQLKLEHSDVVQTALLDWIASQSLYAFQGTWYFAGNHTDFPAEGEEEEKIRWLQKNTWPTTLEVSSTVVDGSQRRLEPDELPTLYFDSPEVQEEVRQVIVQTRIN